MKNETDEKREKQELEEKVEKQENELKEVRNELKRIREEKDHLQGEIKRLEEENSALRHTLQSPKQSLAWDGTSTSIDAATLYALSTVKGVTAFYPVKNGSKIPAKRCYLKVVKNASANNAAFYSLGTNVGETTGISSVENKIEKADVPVYNLAGQLVGKDYKGLVIKNGKKFVIK